MESHRSQTEWEKAVFDRLLGCSFPGSEQLRPQLRGAVVRNLDENGSLEIHVQTGPKAEVSRRVPTEAECVDRDGTKIHFLLHVVNDVANELEIFKEDGSPVLERPSIGALKVV